MLSVFVLGSQRKIFLLASSSHHLSHFISGSELLIFWEKTRTVISDSELATGIDHSAAVPGLPQYLQSLTKLFISVYSVTMDSGFPNCCPVAQEKRPDSRLSVAQLLCSDFYEVRLLVLDATLKWLNQVNSKHGKEREKSLLCLLSGLEEILLRIAVKEKQPECFCKVMMHSPLSPIISDLMS